MAKRSRRAFFWLRRREDIVREIDAELKLHITLTIEELIAEGMDKASAREEAERRFGDFDARHRECTEFGAQRLKSQRRTEVMGELFQDLRYTARAATKKPAFSMVIILTLALGIGVNAAIFSIVDGVLLRPLPYTNPDQLARVWGANRETGEQFLEISYQDYAEFKQQSRAFSAMAAFSLAPRILRDAYGEPKNITVARLSDDLFSVLGVPPALGRSFLSEEFSRSERAVILSHRLWQNRYSANTGMIGQITTIDNEPHTIVGVMPAGYNYPGEADLWRPLTDAEKVDDDPELFMIARLAQGLTLDKAATEVRTIANRIEEARPQTHEHRAAWVQAMHSMLVRDVRTPLLVLLGAVAFVLLIACANIANLLLARGSARQQEIAIRAALGAGRGRIIRQLLTESLFFAVVGGAIGLLIGYLAFKAVVAISPEDIPRISEVALDGRVLAIMTAVTALAGIAFGLIPAIHISKADLQSSLKGGSRSAITGRTKHRLQQSLVVAEVALSTVLVIGASLLIESFIKLLYFDRGFRAENVLVVSLNMRGNNDPQFAVFYDQVSESARALPGVQSVALALRTPVEITGFKIPFLIEGTPEPSNAFRPTAILRPIKYEYFKTVGIRLLSGREFDERDQSEAPRVAIVNEAFARAFFPGSDPVGRRLRGHLQPEQSILIAGMVADVTPDAGMIEGPALYLPFQQMPVRGMKLLIRTMDDPRALIAPIRERIRSLDPNIPLDNIYTLEQKVSDSLAPSRFNMLLVGTFASLALLLAAVGIYGVMSYAVTQRAKEIGIRRALGAQQSGILWIVLKQGLALTLIGLGAGLAGAMWATRMLTTLLFNVSATDLSTFGVVALALGIVAMAASYIPARRAMRLDPVEVLRME